MLEWWEVLVYDDPHSPFTGSLHVRHNKQAAK